MDRGSEHKIKMVNSNINIEELKLYLHHQLDSTNIQIGRLPFEIQAPSTITQEQQKEYDILNFRRLWLQTQLDNIYFSEPNQFPIGMKQASSKEALNHLYFKIF